MSREEMLARQQELLSMARNAGRALTDSERAEFDSLQRSIENLDRASASSSANSGKSGKKADDDDEEGGEDDDGDGDGDGEEDEKKALETARKAERTRIRQITSMCRDFHMEADPYINNGSTVEEVRAAVIEHMRQGGAPLNVNAGIQVTASAEDKFRSAASDALLLRAGMNPERPADGASDLRSMSLRDLAIECLNMDGQGNQGLNRKSSDELYTMLSRGFYNPEAAFPAILDQTIEKAYKEGHRTVAVTFDQFTKKGSLSDFKTHDNYYIAGPVGEFLEVPENGELKHDVFKDDKFPTRKLRTYGRQFTLSRKAFIDDDIGLVTSIPARYAASARKTINKQVFEILLNNPTIYDGLALFGTEHKNLVAEGTGVTQEAVQTMIMALSTQLNQFGEPIIINPAKILVPSGLKFEMYTLFNSPYIETTDNTQAVNPLYQYRSSLEVIEDPTINALCGGMGNVMPWFIFGAASDTDCIEVDYLNGQEIPTIRRMEAPGQLGFIWDIYLDWGISVMDWRGVVKNPGVEVSTKLQLA